MRAIGVALDKATLQQTLYSLGIDRTYDSLTRAQKTELLYYQIMTQTSKMQGELGRTLVTPSSALRIMKQEFTQLARAIGSIFIPIAMKIIPVVRAVVQILTEAAKKIANFFGFNIGDYASDYSVGLEDISYGLEDIEDGATGAAKAMNKMLMPFDELNNINFNTGSSGGASSGIGGLGGTLLDQLPEYNIFDSIVGNIDRDVERIKAKIESMLPVIKAVGIGLATAFAVIKLAEFLSWVKKIHDELSLLGPLGGVIEAGLGVLLTGLGIWGQWQGTKKLLKGDFSIWSWIETLGGTALGTFGIATVLKVLAKTGLFKMSFPNALRIGLGVMLLLQGFQVLKEGIETGNVRKTILGILEGGIGLGAITWKTGFGKILLPLSIDLLLVWQMIEGADDNSDYIRKKFFDGKKEEELTWYQNVAVGINAAGKGFFDTIGTLAGYDMSNFYKDINNIGVAFDENSEYLQDFSENLNNVKDSYKNLKDSILENRDAKLLEISETEGYLESLDRIIDENGRVKGGYEELAEYILQKYSSAFGEQYELIDGVVYKNGQAISSYAEFRDSIDKNIQKMKEEAEQAANISLYEEAYKQRKKLEGELKQAKLEHEQAEIELQKAVEKGIDINSKEFKEIQQHFSETGDASTELRKELEKNYSEITDYSITAFGTLYDSLEKGNGIQADYLQDLFSNDLTAWEKIFDTLDDDQKLLMLKMTSTANTWNPKLTEVWQDMANKMPEKFQNAFNETQSKINTELQKMSTTTQKSSLPKDYKALAEMSKNRFNENFDINSIVTTKIQGASNTMYSNSYVVENASSSLANIVKNNLNNIDTETSGKQSVWGFANGILSAISGTKFGNALGSLANSVVSGIKNKLGIHSPSTVMRDEVGKFIPLGVAEGIDMEANAVAQSVQDLVNKTRVDMQDFQFYNDSSLASSISGRIQSQTTVALNENTLENMTNATYQGMAKALTENTEDYNPQFNVYVGNDKLYSGYANYQSNESNRYGVKV